MYSTELVFFCLATGREIVLNLLCIVRIVFCDMVWYAIALHITYWIIKELSYDIVLGMNWLKSTNPVVYWVACSLELTGDANQHTLLALPGNIVPNVTLPSLKEVLAEVKRGCPA